MRFEALESSLTLIRQLRAIEPALRSRDADLHRQIRKAASSVAMNLAEGSGRRGKDRSYHYTIADGSAREVQTALRVAEAWGDLDEASTQEPLTSCDRVRRLIWGLLH